MNEYQPYTLKDVEENSKKELFTVVSTFAGGGGSSTGYKLSGGKIMVANEINPIARDTYVSNYPNTPVSNMNIRTITGRGSRDRVLEYFSEFGVGVGELDIFDGSPPCTTFSTASGGTGKDKIEKKNIVHGGTDQSRIGMLIHDYVYLVNCLSPKVFVMENVVPSRTSPVFKDGINRIKKHKYKVFWKSVFSPDCGVGQHRTRLITIGVRPDVCKTLGIKSDEDLEFLFPKPIENPVSLRSTLKNVYLDEEEVEMLLDSCRLGSSYEIIKSIPKGGPKHLRIQDIYPEWKETFNSDFTTLRSGWDTTCPTLTCRGQQLGIGGVHHPDYDRKFTVGEMKRIMSLPDDFKLTGTFNDKSERIGNMVPPLVTRTISRSIYDNVLKPFNN